jgi:cell fate regulator YaaT (PSP1 superfamily)
MMPTNVSVPEKKHNDIYTEIDVQMEDAMEMLKESVKENEKYMVSIDCRYVQTLEQENLAWRQWAQSYISKTAEESQVI